MQAATIVKSRPTGVDLKNVIEGKRNRKAVNYRDVVLSRSGHGIITDDATEVALKKAPTRATRTKRAAPVKKAAATAPKKKASTTGVKKSAKTKKAPATKRSATTATRRRTATAKK